MILDLHRRPSAPTRMVNLVDYESDGEAAEVPPKVMMPLEGPRRPSRRPQGEFRFLPHGRFHRHAWLGLVVMMVFLEAFQS